jgi:thiosulfate dehydrogenase [quinone] large subunit
MLRDLRTTFGLVAPDDPVDSGQDRNAGGQVLAAALLPLRFFFGATFLYAGLDKLLDPAFFDASSPASIVAQFTAFIRESPLGGIVQIAEPFAIPIGLLIAIAEIGIGLGALTGLAFRLAATGGAALSFLFWLTASWKTHPYYYGPDLPYAVGWVTLALAGHGGRLVPRRVLTAFARSNEGPQAYRPQRAGWERRPARAVDQPTSPERRLVLQGGVLGFLALAIASLAVPLRMLGVETETAPRPSSSPRVAGPGSTTGPTPTPFGSTPEPSVAPTPAESVAPSPTRTPTPAAPTPTDLAIATVGDVQRQGAVAFTVPFDAPGSLPAGDPGIVIQLADGRFVAYDAVCTHAGCTVEWDSADAILFCPCHGAAFDPAQNAAVLGGPTNQPLLGLPITIDKATGSIVLQG